MNEQKQQMTALTLAASIVIVLSVWGLTILFSPLSEKPQTQEQADAAQKDAVINLAKQAVLESAPYDANQEAPILLKQTQNIGEQHWIVLFDVEQVIAGMSQILYYEFEILDGHLVRQTIALGDKDRKLLVALPEPESILTNDRTTIKGEVFSGQESVQIRVSEVSSSRILVDLHTSVDPLGNVYSLQVDLAAESPELEIHVTDGIVSVVVPVILMNK